MENNGLRVFTRELIRLIMNIFFRPRYHGENYPDSGSYIICSNHFSILDIVFVIMRHKKRWVYFMAKSELYESKAMAWFLNKMGAFPIKRGQSDIASIKRAVTLLKGGELVCIFAQGTRQKDDERLPARRGVAMLAALTQVPVIPVYIESKPKLFKRVNVYIGKPFDTKLNRKSSKEEIADMSEIIMDRVYQLPEGLENK